MPNTNPDTTDPPAVSPDRFDRWFRPLVWAGFLALIYLLRDFFLIGFLTFLICFVVHGLVAFLARRISPRRESHLLELGLIVLVFSGVCAAFYGVGRYSRRH